MALAEVLCLVQQNWQDEQFQQQPALIDGAPTTHQDLCEVLELGAKKNPGAIEEGDGGCFAAPAHGFPGVSALPVLGWMEAEDSETVSGPCP